MMDPKTKSAYDSIIKTIHAVDAARRTLCKAEGSAKELLTLTEGKAKKEDLDKGFLQMLPGGQTPRCGDFDPTGYGNPDVGFQKSRICVSEDPPVFGNFNGFIRCLCLHHGGASFLKSPQPHLETPAPIVYF
ncbi:MAG: hypothetical protein PHC61_01630 [Chitinivibrionales bacterium]|nr:hypothetical protein [Chitinivibrionales bacterium]